MNLPMLAQMLTEAQQRQVMIWGGAMILVAVGGFALIMYLKKYMRDHANQSHDAGFSLSELKQMLYRGEITPEEYETTKAHVIAKVKGNLKAHEERKSGRADRGDGGIPGGDTHGDAPDAGGQVGGGDGDSN